MNLLSTQNRKPLLVCLALWAVFSVYALCNLSHIALVVRMGVEQKDIAMVYYSPSGHWNEGEALRVTLEPGNNEAVFWLPGLLSGSAVRFDPGMNTQTFSVENVSWISTTSDHVTVPLSDISNPRPDASELSLNTALILVAHDNDPQLMVPTLPLITRLWGARWPALVSLFGFALLLMSRWRGWSPVSLAGIYVGAAAIFYFLTSLMIGPRIPLIDDWRYLISSPFNLIDGNWDWLTVVGNDTYFLTNQLFDFVVLNLTNANFFVLRGFAVSTLLVQIAAQFVVIRRVMDTAPSAAAIAVGLCIWSLVSNEYWAATTIAYQQGLPTLFGTLLLLRLTAPGGALVDRRNVVLIMLCCLASGLAYISGGLLLLSLGIAYLLAKGWPSTPRRELLPGYIIAATGLVLLILQFVLVIIQQGSLLQHNHHSESVYPTDHRFWIFFFALFGRAAGYNGLWLPLDMFFCGLILAPSLLLVLPSVRRSFGAQLQSAVMLALYAGMGAATYAAVVAFGRAGFAATTEPATVITAMGKGRFHFWPVAAMLPYAWIGWYLVTTLVLRVRVAALGTVATLLLIPKSLPVMDYVSFARQMADGARDGARCVVEHEKRLPDTPLNMCLSLTGVPADIGNAVDRLKARNSPTYRELMREGTGAE